MAVHHPARPLDEGTLFAEYPFLPGADALLAREAVSVRSLLEDTAYERVRSIGRARILSAQDDPRGSGGIEEIARADADVRYLSFLFARLVLSAAPLAGAIRRWAVAEAKRSYARLRDGSAAELEEVARRLGFPFVPIEGGVGLALTDYLRLAAPIREAEFRLPSQAVKAGTVRVEPVRAARLLQEAVRGALAVPLPLDADVIALVREREAELLGEVARRLPAPVGRGGSLAGPLRRSWFPPCIRRMQRTLEKGENLSHSGRFALAAFLHRVGADSETIVDAYRGAPDFDESVTRYQVDHITTRDGGRGYEPPECDTLRSHGLCARDGDPDSPVVGDRLRDPACYEPTLRHPLQYYRRKGGSVVEPEREGAAPPTETGRARGTSGERGRTPSTGRRR